MAWPTPQDYNEAIQNPRQNCADAELASGTPELTKLGLPRPITGNFASVYRVHCAGRDWAVRCFWREYSDMQERYQAISRHLQAAHLPYTVGCQYLPRGIKVKGKWYPILKMEWVEGELLSMYAERHLHEACALDALAQRWRVMIRALEGAGLAHGDLQHGNVLVVGGELKLVDYDGMYVPALAGRGSHELGHQHYQHPRRGAADFGPNTDRFSALAIYLSLVSLSRQPDLWTELRAGDECLLLRHQDYTRPENSDAFRLLEAQAGAETRHLLAALRTALQQAPSRAPALESVFGPAEHQPGPEHARSQYVRALWQSVVPGTHGPHESPAEPLGSAPAWVQDHVAAISERASFRGPVLIPRVSSSVMAAGLVALAVLASLIFMPALLVAAVCCALVAANAGAILASFHHEPVVRAVKLILHRERVQLRALSVIQREIRRLEKTRARRDEEFSRRAEQAAQRHAAMEGRERSETETAQERLESARRETDERRKELQTLQRQKVEARLEDLRARHLDAYLNRQLLWSAKLPEAGRVLTARLWLMGIRTAGDVTSEKIALIRTMDAEANAAICAWRVEKELEARRSLPTVLPTGTLNALAEEFGRRRQKIENVWRKKEERAAALAATIEKRHKCRRAEHETIVRADHQEQAALCAGLEQALDEARQRESVAAAQLARIRRELQPFGGITFGRYMRTVLLP